MALLQLLFASMFSFLLASFQHVIPEDVDHLLLRSLRKQKAFQKTVVKDLFDSSTKGVRSNTRRLNSDQTAQLKPLRKQEQGVDREHVLSLLEHNYSKLVRFFEK